MTEFTHGWMRSPPDSRDMVFAAPMPMEGLPPLVDLSAKLPPSNDQGRLGSCGPHALDQLINYNQKNQNMPFIETSKLFTYWNTRKLMGTTEQDSGVENRSMLKAAKAMGVCVPESIWPYDVIKYKTQPPPEAYNSVKKITSYSAVSQTLQQMKATLNSGFPFLFGFSVFPAMQSQAVTNTGDIPMPAGQSIGGHDVIICGYDDTSRKFKIQNSWSIQWGYHGFGSIPYEYAVNPSWAGDFWVITGIEGTPVPPVDPDPPKPSTTKFITLQGFGPYDGRYVCAK